MDKIDKWLPIDKLAGCIRMSRKKLNGMALPGGLFASKIGTQWRSNLGDRSVAEAVSIWKSRL